MKPTILILLSLMIYGCGQTIDVNIPQAPSSKESSNDFCNIELVSSPNSPSTRKINSFNGDYSIGDLAERNELVLEIYAQGELKKTFGSSLIIYDNPTRIGEVKFDIHIIAHNGYKITVVIKRGNGTEIFKSVSVSQREFNCDKAISCHAFPASEKKDNELPLFYIIGNSADGGSTLGGSPEELLERNPTAFIMVGSLRFK